MKRMSFGLMFFTVLFVLATPFASAASKPNILVI